MEDFRYITLRSIIVKSIYVCSVFYFRYLENFKRGIRANGVFYKCRDAQILKDRKIRIVLIEGKNREIRKIFDKFGIPYKSKDRGENNDTCRQNNRTEKKSRIFPGRAC